MLIAGHALQASKTAVGIIIVVINAALLLFYAYLIIQFLVLPRLGPWVQRLLNAEASKPARWWRGVPEMLAARLSSSWRPAGELVLDDATGVVGHCQRSSERHAANNLQQAASHHTVVEVV